MLRELTVGVVAFAVGYVIGAVSGFNAAVHDYIENDAELLQEQALTVYGEEKLVTMTMDELMETFEKEFDDSDDNAGSRGFQ